MEKKCNHLIGNMLNESGFVSEIYLSEITEQKLEKMTEGSDLFKFCPHCGSALSEDIKKTLIQKNEAELKKKEKETEEKRQKKEILNNKIDKVLNHPIIQSLEDDKIYILKFKNNRPNDNRPVLIRGKKETMARDFAHSSYYLFIKEQPVLELLVKEICPTEEEFRQILTSAGWNDAGKNYYTKKNW